MVNRSYATLYGYQSTVQSSSDWFLSFLPSVDHLVTFLKPADPRHLTPRSGSVHVDDQVIFSHEHLETAHHIPGGAGRHAFYQNHWVTSKQIKSAVTDSQEEVFHDVVVVGTAAIRQVAGREYNDGIQALAVIA